MTDPISEAIAAFRANDLGRAESIASTVLSRDASHSNARLILGGVYVRTRRFDLAVPALQEVLQQDPGCRDALVWIIEALRRSNWFEDAAQYADEARRLFPSDAEFLYLAGMCLRAVGRYQEAEMRFRSALKLSRRPHILHYLGVCLLKLDRPEEAAASLEEAAKAEPHVPNHLVHLGYANLRLYQLELATQCAQRALQLRPGDPEADLLVANILSEQGRLPEAEEQLRKVLASDPHSGEANRLMQTWLVQMGRFEEAESYFDRAIEADPTDTLPYFYKLQFQKTELGHAPLLDAMKAKLQAPDVRDPDRLPLLYGLAKASIDLGDYPAAFGYYDAANDLSFRIHRSQNPFDPVKLRSFVDWVIETFSPESFERWAEFGSKSARPLFVVGMMRSGTTLMEQLLSAHPEVAGAGELNFWMGRGTGLVDDASRQLDASRIASMAADYLSLLQQRDPFARFVIDKMPPNELMLGFIHACFPNARIVQMVRDPLDVCLSIWMTFIERPPDFANNKRNIMEAYAQHERLRNLWASVLPEDRYMSVRYEDLTRDPETVMRRVLAFCDLEWDEACIHPERNERLVQTASLFRVRSAIDSASVSKKDRFGPYLGEFATLAERGGPL